MYMYIYVLIVLFAAMRLIFYLIWLMHMEVGLVRILHPDYEEVVKMFWSKLIFLSCKLIKDSLYTSYVFESK